VVAWTADLPLHNPHHDSLSSADAADESRCPFLASLRSPPMVNMPWLKRVQYQVCAQLNRLAACMDPYAALMIVCEFQHAAVMQRALL
jgi:hypothetical protein